MCRATCPMQIIALNKSLLEQPLSLPQRLPQVCKNPLLLVKEIINSTKATTTVDSDGSTHTQVHPYDPSTDPPPASETTITSSTQPGSSENPNNNTEYTTMHRNSTSGGRPIPPRSELRNSQNSIPQPHTQPQSQTQYQPLSQYQSQSQYQQPPLASHPPAPLSPSEPLNSTYCNQPSNAAYQNQTPDHASHQGSTYPTSSIYSNQSSDHTHHGKRESLMAGMKALHGAGEALRGTVNSKIAGKLGDEQDAVNQRKVREQGLREVRETGIRDRVPLVHGGKLRKRSLSRGMGEERRPLERVDESEANF